MCKQCEDYTTRRHTEKRVKRAADRNAIVAATRMKYPILGAMRVATNKATKSVRLRRRTLYV